MNGLTDFQASCVEVSGAAKEAFGYCKELDSVGSCAVSVADALRTVLDVELVGPGDFEVAGSDEFAVSALR